MYVLLTRYMTRHPFRGRCTPHAAVADRRRAAGLARAAADDLASRRPTQSGPAAVVGPVAGRLRRPGSADRGAGRSAEGVRGGRGPAVGAEPTVAPPGPHATPRP